MVSQMSRKRWIRLFFLVLVAGLFLQLPLRNVTEPYPAILLPAGGNVLRSQGEITGQEREYLLEDASGKTYSVSVDALLGSVPRNYWPVLVDRGFGINSGREVRRPSLSVFGRPVQLQFGRPLTPAQIEETRAWIRSKLKDALGIDAVRIYILTYTVTTFYSGSSPARRERQLRSRTTVELFA